MPNERRRVFYAGRVQGVGFRFTTERIARRFPVSGHVRNLDDGRVEVVAEGEAGPLAEFLAAIEREFGSKIHEVRVEEEPARGEALAGFSIRY